MFNKTGIKLYSDLDIDFLIEPFYTGENLNVLIGKKEDNIEWLIKQGQPCEKFAVLAKCNDLPVYSPASGVLININVIHVKGHDRLYAEILQDKDQPPIKSVLDGCSYETSDQLVELLKCAGIFDDYRKNNLFIDIENTNYKSIILTCADDEPYSVTKTAAFYSFRQEIIDGLLIIAHTLQVEHKYIAYIKNFKTAEIFKNEEIKLINLKSRYPVSVKLKKIAKKYSALIVGPELCRAVYRAVNYKEPFTKKLITVWGDGIIYPKVLEVAVGTPIHTVLDRCGAKSSICKIVASGVMSGYLTMPEYPVNPFDNSITVLNNISNHKKYACINCGRCSEVCPMGLAPYYILQKPLTKNKNKFFKSFSRCIECGCCTYICPAKLPLRSYIKSFNAQQSRERSANEQS